MYNRLELDGSDFSRGAVRRFGLTKVARKTIQYVAATIGRLNQRCRQEIEDQVVRDQVASTNVVSYFSSDL